MTSEPETGGPEEIEREILARFDGSSASEMPLARLGEPRVVAPVVAGLVERGLLRCAPGGNAYIRTEDGRLRLAGPLDVTVYSRPGCHLCEEAKAQMAPLLAEFGARLCEINIDADPVLRSRYDYDVPVVVLGNRKVAKHRLNLEQFRRQLRDAAS